MKRVVLIGAGGNLGSFVLPALVKQPDLEVTIISRNSSKCTFDSKLKVVKVDDDYPEDSLVNAFRGQDVVIVMTNARVGSTETHMIDAAIKAGVKRFIPSNFGGVAENENAVKVFPLLSGHEKIVDYLRSKESTGLTWTAIITGIFIDLAMGNSFMGYDFTNKRAKIWDSGNAKFSASTRDQIAKAVVAVLAHQEATKNRYVYIESFVTSQNEILRTIEKTTNSQWDVENVKTDDMIVIGREGMKNGDFLKAGNLALAALYSGYCGADFEADGKLSNDALGLAKEDLDRFIGDLTIR